VFSAGGRFFSQAAPAPGTERPLGSTAPGKARQTVLLRCSKRSGGALAAASRRAIPSTPRVCRSALGGSSKPDRGTPPSIVREAIFRRLRNQAPTPSPHPFFFAGARPFPFARFESRPPLSWPSNESLSRFPHRRSFPCTQHRSPSAGEQKARFAWGAGGK
jgi:hypothetical protein